MSETVTPRVGRVAVERYIGSRTPRRIYDSPSQDATASPGNILQYQAGGHVFIECIAGAGQEKVTSVLVLSNGGPRMSVGH